MFTNEIAFQECDRWALSKLISKYCNIEKTDLYFKNKLQWICLCVLVKMIKTTTTVLANGNWDKLYTTPWMIWKKCRKIETACPQLSHLRSQSVGHMLLSINVILHVLHQRNRHTKYEHCIQYRSKLHVNILCTDRQTDRWMSGYWTDGWTYC